MEKTNSDGDTQTSVHLSVSVHVFCVWRTSVCEKNNNNYMTKSTSVLVTYVYLSLFVWQKVCLSVYKTIICLYLKIVTTK